MGNATAFCFLDFFSNDQHTKKYTWGKYRCCFFSVRQNTANYKWEQYNCIVRDAIIWIRWGGRNTIVFSYNHIIWNKLKGDTIVFFFCDNIYTEINLGKIQLYVFYSKIQRNILRNNTMVFLNYIKKWKQLFFFCSDTKNREHKLGEHTIGFSAKQNTVDYIWETYNLFFPNTKDTEIKWGNSFFFLWQHNVNATMQSHFLFFFDLENTPN